MITLPKLPDLKPRERLLAVGCGVVLVIVVMDRLVLGPWTRHAHTVRQEIHQMERALQSQQRILARRERVFAELQRYQQYLQPSIADDLQKAALVTDIQHIAGESHVTLGEIKPLATEADETTKHYPLELHFICTLDEWLELLYRIETAPALYEVTRAQLSVQENEPDRLAGYLRLVSVSLQRVTSTMSGDAGGTHAGTSKE